MKIPRIKYNVIAGAFLISLLNMSATASEEPKPKTPYTMKDGDWITLKGKVTNTGPDAFTLDYGPGSITVEMDDYDSIHEGETIYIDDEVTVTGRIDADSNEQRSIEAMEVHIPKLQHSFYANADDEEEVIAKFDQETTSREAFEMVKGTIVDFLENGYLVQTNKKRVKIITSELDDEIINRIITNKDIGLPISFIGIPGDGYGTQSSFIAVEYVE